VNPDFREEKVNYELPVEFPFQTQLYGYLGRSQGKYKGSMNLDKVKQDLQQVQDGIGALTEREHIKKKGEGGTREKKT